MVGDHHPLSTNKMYGPSLDARLVSNLPSPQLSPNTYDHNYPAEHDLDESTSKIGHGSPE
jgi:hypothetical protein